MNDFLYQIFYGNTVLRYIVVAGIILIGFLILKVIKRLLFKALKRWSKNAKKIVILLLEVADQTVLPLLYVSLLYTSISILNMPENIRKIVNNIMMVVFVFFVIRILILVVQKSFVAFLKRQHKGKAELEQLGGLLLVINIIGWSIGVMFLMGNLGYDITTIIAGLGIGGIAIALAAQAVLGDFFSYFVIFFDKPFDVGDFIEVDGLYGTIMSMGLKTTKLRELIGDELTIPNSDLAKAKIHNYSRMNDRRITFHVDIVKETPLSKVKLFANTVNEMIKKHPKADLVRGHLLELADFSFKYEFTYYVTDADYTVYLDVQQAFNFGILDLMEHNDMKLAYPTQKLNIISPDN
ncbi:MAG: mechanosensitive ion channel family protein [Flavobacterium sp.]